MNTLKIFLACLTALVLSSSGADSTVDVAARSIQQSTYGSDIDSRINLGSVTAGRADGVRIHVSVGDVTNSSTGNGTRSFINIGSAEGASVSGFSTEVIVTGRVVLETNGGDGEINIGSQTSR